MQNTNIQLEVSFFQAILDAIPVPLFYKDTMYRYQGCNQAFLAYIGLTREQLIGKTPLDIAPSDLAKRYMEMDRQLFEHPGKQTYESSVVYASDHKRHDVIFYKATYCNANGVVMGLVGLILDITETKQTENQYHQTLLELQTTQQYVIRQERLNALGQMASGIAHDFNNSLTPIIGFADLLLQVPQQLQDLDRARECIKNIKTCAQDAANTVKRLREFYRRRSNNAMQATQLNNIVQETISLTEPLWKNEMQRAGKPIQIITQLGILPEFLSSPSEIREILTNLILNATDAMPHGGTITITTKIQGRWATLMVADNGVGMSEEIRRRCLEPFFTTKGDKGSGLGLAAVYGIVQRHCGQLEIESKVGQGTCFTIRLPMQPTKEEDDSQRFAPPNFCMQILIVDDNPNTSAVVQAYLNTDLHAWQLAKSGREALQKLRQHHFDMVITEQSMSDMDGEQLAAIIKHELGAIPVVMITGFSEKFGDDLPFGVDSLIQKPLSLHQLRETIFHIRHDQVNKKESTH